MATRRPRRPSRLRRLVLALVLAGTFLAGSAVGPTVRSALQRTPAVPAATASATPAHAVKRNEEVRLRVVPDAVLVKFEPGTPQRVMTGLFARAGVAPKTVVSDIGVRVLRVPPERREAVLALLKSSVVVEYAEREVVVEALDVVPNDPRWSSQWGPRVVSAPEAWDTTRGSRSVVVAVVDTGVNPEHPDLSGALVPGYDFVNNDADPSDDNGHGTAVAGVVAARTNNGVGEAGLCWTCSIMPIKALDANGSGSTATIAKAIVLAADNGADIINLSLGGPATTQTLTDAVDYAASKGVLIFAAAGNNGETAFFYPAAYPQVLAVAGTDEADHVYSWSNHGPWVQVSAPGCNVAPLLGGGYGDFCGTSSATPIVSGLAGLVLAAKPGATRDEVYTAIKATAKQVGSKVAFGRVDAAGTLFAAGATSTPATTSVTFAGTLTPDRRTRTYSRSAGAGSLSLKLTIPSSTKLTLRLVNGAGKTVASRWGRSPLFLSKTVRAGRYRFVVRGGFDVQAGFKLMATYRAP